MSIVLTRADILQVEPISSQGTLKLLPPGKKNKQKLVIGDDSGQLSCFEFKKGEPQVVFQIKLFEGPIASVALGGPVSARDRLFVAQGQKIIGVTKKGKEFFKLSSPVTENIHDLFVDDTRLWVSYEYIHNVYDNGKENAFYMSRDLINAFDVSRIIKSSQYDAILGCQDDCIRVVQGSDLILEIPALGPVTALFAFQVDDSRHRGSNNINILYGSQNGAVSIIHIEPGGAGFTHGWSIDDKKSSVTCVRAFDLTRDGTMEIIVAREDGSVEVYTQESPDHAPNLAFAEEIGESVRALECGLVNSSDYNEIIVASYSGKIISFTAEPVMQRAQDDTYGRSSQTVNNENRIKYLRKEVEGLRAKLEKEKEKVKKVSVQNVMKPPPDFSIISKFALDADLAAYTLSIELQSSIDLIILRSPVFLEFTDTGNALVSITPPQLLQAAAAGSEESSYKFVVAFRCQNIQERRVNITVRTTEGEYGELVATVVAGSNPKAAKVVKFSLKPLSLHAKVHMLTDEQLARPRNRIRFSGQVALTVLHEWVQAIFPDIPPGLSEDATVESYRFKHTFTSAVTFCEMKKNEIIFESESASTIAIIKENITRLANYRRVLLDENLSCNDASIKSFLDLIKPKLTYQISLARKMDIIDAVQEISMQDQSSSSWLSPEYADILGNQERIRKEFKLRAKSLEYLSGIITDLFVDWNRLRGQDVRTKIAALHQVLLSNNIDQVVETILGTASSRLVPASLRAVSK